MTQDATPLVASIDRLRSCLNTVGDTKMVQVQREDLKRLLNEPSAVQRMISLTERMHSQADDLGHSPDERKGIADATWNLLIAFRDVAARLDQSTAPARIILVSQDRNGSSGYQLHGLFHTFTDAAHHVAKDAGLTDEQRQGLVEGWNKPGDRHESAEVGEWWVAARQPIRSEKEGT
jgi:hypothetical protein